jgi:two-component system, NtrC family, sensor kinase
MRPLADAACELPWLAPCAASLVALTRQSPGSLWPALRCDPGLVLLLLRLKAQHRSTFALSYYSSLLCDPGVLELALEGLGREDLAFVDWRQPQMLPIYRAAIASARTAEALALQTDRCDSEHAWVGGLLAPLGWFAAAAHGDRAASAWQLHQTMPDPTKSTEQPCGLDAQAIARRVTARWHLPAWLGAVAGHLSLPVEAARALGADPDHFLIVQLATTLVEEAGFGLRLAVGTTRQALTSALDLKPDTVQKILTGLKASVNALVPPQDWQAPAGLPLLPDLLRLALINQKTSGAEERSRLHAQVDALHNTVQKQKADEAQCLKEQKLRALAELAAGAGHEINNPLAVISGQAQYLMLSEQEPARIKALQTIVGQTQRIHQTLTQLMQFARPAAPQKQQLDAGGLLSEVVGGLQSLADERQVRLSCEPPPAALTLFVDPAQIRVTMAALLRNAIEAAPAGGWASLRLVNDLRRGVSAIFEDSGPGPTPVDREHLFDPFYSGRRAGRGRGLGLPTAWQFARLHGGDVRYDATESGPTRFVLTLPLDSVVDAVSLLPERNNVNGCHALAQSA